MRRIPLVLAVVCVLVAISGFAAADTGIEGPPGDPSCSDGVDNDGDTWVDLDDLDCNVIVVDYGIWGTVYDDANANGFRDDDEPGLAGWTVHIVDEDGFDYHVDTDDDGFYVQFVAPKRFLVCETLQTAWSQTEPAGENLCDGHAGAASRGYVVDVGATEYPEGGFAFGNRLNACERDGLSGGPTVANQMLGAEHEDTPIAGRLHEAEGSAPEPLCPAMHEAACAASAAEQLVAG